MSRPARSIRKAVTLAALALALPLAACTSAAEEDGAVAVTASDSECSPSSTELASGVTEFKVTNKGSQTTELYVLRPDGSIAAERENIAPGIATSVNADLKAGDYTLRCRPNDTSEGVATAITVSGDAPASELSPALTKALADYRTYVEENAGSSLVLTRQLAEAVKANDIPKAKQLYGESRVGWERVEPVAESFGDLDPRIDLREADLETGAEWTGWHVIEKALWANNTTQGMGPVADQLVKDLEELELRVRKVEITPTSMANGAKELLDEVATGKVTGEEEAFSHLDFVDMQANVDGAKQVFMLLGPELKAKDAALDQKIAAEFAKVEARLQTLRTGPGPADFKLYTELDENGRKALAADVNALAEPLSGLAGAVAG